MAQEVLAMFRDVRNRIHRRGDLIHNSVENAFLTASATLFTLLTLLIIYFGVFLSRAS